MIEKIMYHEGKIEKHDRGYLASYLCQDKTGQWQAQTDLGPRMVATIEEAMAAIDRANAERDYANRVLDTDGEGIAPGVLADLLISDGYIGESGRDWHTPTTRETERAIEKAMVIENKTRDEIIAIISQPGRGVRWCESPNFYYDHSYGLIGRKRTATPPEMVRCTCGHTVPRTQVMQASTGTACPDCYDDMSD